MENRDTRKLTDKLKQKYRLIIRVEDSLEEKTSFKLTRLNVIMIISTTIIIGFFSVYILIAYTSLKQYIPGYGDFNTIRKFSELSIKYDSLQKSVNQQINYLENIRKIYSGKVEEYSDSSYNDKGQVQAHKKVYLTKKSKADSILRAEVENEASFNVLYTEEDPISQKLKSFIFYAPVNGKITERFNPLEKHYAIDIVAEPNIGIKSVLDGTVIYADWSIAFGYTIIIQHKKNLLSVYKHNSVLLKNIGSFVRAGEVIAIIGDTGKLSNGAHLHFELWYDGNAVDPEKFIVFN